MEQEALSKKISIVSEQLPPEGVRLADLRKMFGRDGAMLLTAFMTLIFLIPVSIPGVSTVFGGAILVLALGRILHRDVWLPKRLETRVVSTEKLRGALARGLVWFRRLERISRPGRLASLASHHGLMNVINNLGLILGAILLMAPFGLIPFSNTLPAVALLFLAIGLMQRDGACIVVGHVMNVMTIAYFVFLIAGGGVLLQKLWQRYV